jgi:hypothetical protein
VFAYTVIVELAAAMDRLEIPENKHLVETDAKQEVLTNHKDHADSLAEAVRCDKPEEDDRGMSKCCDPAKMLPEILEAKIGC